MMLYRTIVADPPWQLKIGKARTMRGEAHCGWSATDGRRKELVENYVIRNDLAYPQMTVAEIAALKVPADSDAHCYIWTINKYVEAAYSVMRAWGFEPSTLLTWAKAPMGLGLGGTFCNSAEFVLFGRRGNLRAARRVDRTWWNWKRGAHSVKPEAFQDIVETVSPGPYLEMFARRARIGWDVWGNEVESDVQLRMAA